MHANKHANTHYHFIIDMRYYRDKLSFVLMSFHRSVVTATVLYDSNSIVDISQIQKRLLLNDTTANISIRDNSEAEVRSTKMCYA